MSFPKLPSLEDLEETPINEPYIVPEEHKVTKRLEDDNLSLPSLPDIESEDIESEFENENNSVDDVDFEDISESLDVNNKNNFAVDLNDQLEEELEESFGFLPDVLEEPIEKEITKQNKSIERKELNDEAVKQFFVNIKNKLVKHKDKKNGYKKPKIKRKVKSNSNKNAVDIKKTIISIIIAILTISMGLFILNNIDLGGKMLKDIAYENKGEEVVVLMDNLDKSEDNIKLALKNRGDISTKFIVDIEFAVKKTLFKKDKFICRSDIIFLEPGEVTRETLTCLDFVKSDKYNVSVDFTEIK